MKKIGTFLKNNIYYVILIVCVIAIATMVSIAIWGGGGKNNIAPPPSEGEGPTGEEPGDNKPAETKPIVFALPALGNNVINPYVDDDMVWNKTLKEYSVHMAIDYAAPLNSDVYAVYDGTVESVYYDFLEGHVIVIKHNNNLKTLYGSLSDDIDVRVGDKIVKGDVIGKIGNSAAAECMEAAHLHFETLYNGVSINPKDYFNFENK